MSNVALVSADFPGIVRPARLVAAVGFAVVIGCTLKLAISRRKLERDRE